MASHPDVGPRPRLFKVDPLIGRQDSKPGESRPVESAVDTVGKLPRWDAARGVIGEQLGQPKSNRRFGIDDVHNLGPVAGRFARHRVRVCGIDQVLDPTSQGHAAVVGPVTEHEARFVGLLKNRIQHPVGQTLSLAGIEVFGLVVGV